MQSGELPEFLCINVEFDWFALVQATTAFASSCVQQPCHVHKVLFHSSLPVFQFLWEQGQGWLAHPGAARDLLLFAQLVRSSEPFRQNFSTPRCKLHWSDPDHTGFTRQAEDRVLRERRLYQHFIKMAGRPGSVFGSIRVLAGGWWSCKSKAKDAMKMPWS